MFFLEFICLKAGVYGEFFHRRQFALNMLRRNVSGTMRTNES